jgi:hypothetical protein
VLRAWENVIVGRLPEGTGSVMVRWRELAAERDCEFEAVTAANAPFFSGAS